MRNRSRLSQEARTMSLTCLPRRMSQDLRVLRPCFRHRHQLVFSWLLVLPLVYGDWATLKALAGMAPGVWPSSTTVTYCARATGARSLAVVVCRPSLAGFSSTRGWHPLSGGRQLPQGQPGLQASDGPENAPQPVPSIASCKSLTPILEDRILQVLFETHPRFITIR
jgi:hypothetical protein